MMNSKKEVIKNFLFEGTDDMKKEKFELTWDIWETFEAIKSELSRENIFKPLESRIWELIEEPYEITFVDWGSVYVSKSEWKQKENDRGIYALCIEKWNRNWPTVGIVRNAPFTTNLEKKIEEVLSPKGFRSTKWFLGYIPIPDWQYGNPKTYYFDVFFNPYSIVDFLFNYFEKVYKTLKETAGLEELLDRSVEERKTQLQKAP